MDAMMAYHRLTTVTAGGPTAVFDQLPLAAGTAPSYDSNGILDPASEYEHLYPSFLRLGDPDSPAKMCYTWNAVGYVRQGVEPTANLSGVLSVC